MSDILTRETTRKELRQALKEHLSTGGEQPGADLVEEVSLEVDAAPRRVLAALWDLVEDGDVRYLSGARVSLLD